MQPEPWKKRTVEWTWGYCLLLPRDSSMSPWRMFIGIHSCKLAFYKENKTLSTRASKSGASCSIRTAGLIAGEQRVSGPYSIGSLKRTLVYLGPVGPEKTWSRWEWKQDWSFPLSGATVNTDAKALSPFLLWKRKICGIWINLSNAGNRDNFRQTWRKDSSKANWQNIDQWFSTFLILQPFNRVTHVVVTPKLKIVFITLTLLLLWIPVQIYDTCPLWRGHSTPRQRITNLDRPSPVCP